MKALYYLGVIVNSALAIYVLQSIYLISSAFIEGNVYESDINYFIIKLALYIAGILYLANLTFKLLKEIKRNKTQNHN